MGTLICACGDDSSTGQNASCKSDFEFKESIAAMDWGDDTTYVFGHKTPDVGCGDVVLGLCGVDACHGAQCSCEGFESY